MSTCSPVTSRRVSPIPTCRHARRSCSRPTRSPAGSSPPTTATCPRCRPPPRLVAARAGLADDRWTVAWQSAGRTSEPWLEPDLLGVIDALGADEQVDGVLVCPCGFVADHLEVLYDLDIEAAKRAAAAGLTFRRTQVVNDDSGVMSALARRIAAAARVMTRRVVVVGGGIAGLTVAERLGATLDQRRRDRRAARGRRSARRRPQDVAVRRARRRSTRAPTPSSPGSPTAPPSPNASASPAS